MEFFYGLPASGDSMWCAEVASVIEFCNGSGLDPGAGGRTISPETMRADVGPHRVPHVRATADSLPFRDEAFDFVFTCHLIEHMRHPQQAIVEWLRVVRSGGHVALIVPNTIYTMGQNTDPTPHYNEWSPRDFARDVLQVSQNFPCVDFSDRASLQIEWANAELVRFDEACPRWSFCVVLRKGDGRGQKITGGFEGRDRRSSGS